MKVGSRQKRSTKLRFSAAGAYARGNETRSRLIATAIRLFGQHGFDGASTRDIAAAAELNTPALQYYFDNKQGLYVACAEHIVTQAWSMMKDVVMAAEQALARHADDETLIEAFCAVQNRLADFLNDASGDWLLWIARERMLVEPKSGYMVRHRTSRRMMRVGRMVVARLLGKNIGDPECFIHETALNGHLVHFYLMHRSALEVLGWRVITPDRLNVIKRIARAHTLSSLRAIIDTRQVHGPGGARVAVKKRAAAARSGRGVGAD